MKSLLHRRKHFISSGGWDLSANTVAQYLCNDNLETTVVLDVEGTNGTASTDTDNLHVAGKVGTGAFDFTAASTESVNCNQTFQTTIRSANTFSCWIKPNDGQPAAFQFVFGSVETGVKNYFQLALLSTGKLIVYFRSNGNIMSAETSSAVFADGATSWTHVLFTVSATAIVIYINGSSVGVTGGDTTGLTLADYTNTKNMYLGARNNAGSIANYFDGVIDDFRVMDKVTTQAEINGIYNDGDGTEAQSG